MRYINSTQLRLNSFQLIQINSLLDVVEVEWVAEIHARSYVVAHRVDEGLVHSERLRC